jgi:hypothetical protein
MGHEEAVKLRDNRDESDVLVEQAGLLEAHHGPFRVECEEPIREFFAPGGAVADQTSIQGMPLPCGPCVEPSMAHDKARQIR